MAPQFHPNDFPAAVSLCSLELAWLRAGMEVIHSGRKEKSCKKNCQTRKEEVAHQP
jgi:hypothetical protein